MSYLFTWLLGKSTNELSAMKDERLEKIAKLQKEVEEIDKQIEAAKNEK